MRSRGWAFFVQRQHVVASACKVYPVPVRSSKVPGAVNDVLETRDLKASYIIHFCWLCADSIQLYLYVLNDRRRRCGNPLKLLSLETMESHRSVKLR